jgi:transcriptional regulator with XRE-family HTH domain
MPGRKMEKRLLTDIGARATKIGVTGPLYIHDWIADGRTLKELADELNCSRSFLSRILNGNPDYREALQAGRKEQAEKMAEDSLDLVDSLAHKDELTTQDVSLAKERVSVRKWLSAMNSPERFAHTQQNLTVNIGELHLSALKKAKPALESLQEAGQLIEGQVVKDD